MDGTQSPVDNIPPLHPLQREAVVACADTATELGMNLYVFEEALPTGKRPRAPSGHHKQPRPTQGSEGRPRGEEATERAKALRERAVLQIQSARARNPTMFGFSSNTLLLLQFGITRIASLPFHHQFSAGAMNPTQTRPAKLPGCHDGMEQGPCWPLLSSPRPSGHAPSFRRHRACLAATAIAAGPAERAA